MEIDELIALQKELAARETRTNLLLQKMSDAIETIALILGDMNENQKQKGAKMFQTKEQLEEFICDMYGFIDHIGTSHKIDAEAQRIICQTLCHDIQGVVNQDRNFTPKVKGMGHGEKTAEPEDTATSKFPQMQEPESPQPADPESPQPAEPENAQPEEPESPQPAEPQPTSTIDEVKADMGFDLPAEPKNQKPDTGSGVV